MLKLLNLSCPGRLKLKTLSSKKEIEDIFYEIMIFESIKNVTILRQLGVIIKSQQSENHEKCHNLVISDFSPPLVWTSHTDH